MWPQWRDKPEWSEHEWWWMQMRCGCHVELCRCDVMWWCHVSKWSTNHWQQCGNTEINNNRIQLSKRDNKNKRKGQNHKLLSVSAPESPPFEVVCFRDWQGLWWGVFWGVDKLARTFCCALRLYLWLMVPKHKAITKHNSTKRLLPSKVQAAELQSIIVFWVFFFLPHLPFQFPLQLLIFWKSLLFNFNHCLWNLTYLTDVLWHSKRLGFWVSRRLTIYLINGFMELFFFFFSWAFTALTDLWGVLRRDFVRARWSADLLCPAQWGAMIRHQYVFA